MDDEMTGLTTKPTYQASLRLACGATARATVVDGAVLFDIRDDSGRLVPATMTRRESREVASLLDAADRNA